MPSSSRAYGAVVLDLRDQPIAPSEGCTSRRAWRRARLAGSQFDYLEFTSEARGFLSIGPIVLAARARRYDHR